MMKLPNGTTAVVTGAAQGIGLAIARRLIGAGARVVVGDIKPPTVTEDFLFKQTDVADEESVRALVATAVEAGGLDIFINNAGIAVEKTITDTTVDEWDRVMAVNVRGVFLCAKHAITAMRKCGGGAIVNIGSIEGLGANASHAAYAASKGAVHALTRNIALEAGADGIRCNAIAPGWIDTPFNDNLISQYPDPERARAAISGLHPVGRLGTPDDIAEMALWLASDASTFVSGQVVVCDGGRTARLPLPAL
ncbi:glucose 1-dehydrogenase [Candidatus Persebacteraceae bacterium Df01]|jgi:meso-butanediol dehydrogenase/(S,S)-butanediol dehydrogenase/diacetyl reductase|uniref:Glucose 1-dehydrogenase n=1 Tax=Candidatus Doriopsillibacter californiensis TaxID=2970740 RepID=A0ABT7QKB0_9GAMM|nr:glucose 1-dehydrogenase [Candidatus Persebacteraceae bacterium Df01]